MCAEANDGEKMNNAVIGAGVVLGVAGSLMTAQQLAKGLEMETQHWLMLLIFLAAGYVAGRMFPQLGQTVGLP